MQRDETFHSATEDSARPRSRSRSKDLYEDLRRTSRLKNFPSLNPAKRLSVKYPTVSQLSQNNLLPEMQSQSQTMKSDDDTSDRKTLNLEYENSDREQRNASNSHKTPPTREMLSPPPTKPKQRAKRTQPNKKITVTWSRKKNEEYRCTLRNNTHNLAQKFNFATKKNFRKLMKNDNDQLFRIIKQVLSTYQNLNTTAESLQQNLTLVTADKSRLETRVEAQKQKIENIFKKKRNATTRMNKLKKLIRIREEKITKLRRSRNAHRENFEKVDAKIKSLLIDKKNMKKTIERFEHRLKNTERHVPLKDSDNKKFRPNAWDSRRPTNITVRSEKFRRILRRNELLTD